MINYKFNSALAAALLGTITVGHGQLPVSKVAEIKLTSLVGGVPKFVAVPAYNSALARGVITTISTDDLTLDVIAGTFTGLSGEFAAQVVTNGARGRTFEVDEASSAGSIVRLTGFSASGVTLTPGVDEIQVVRKHTLDTAFPQGGMFKGGTSPGNADRLYVTGSGGSLVIGYYKTDLPGWVNSGNGAPIGSTSLPLNSSLLVIPQATAPGAALVKGLAPSGKQVVTFPGGNGLRFVGSPYGKALTLADLTASVTAGGSPGASDLVYIVEGSSLKIVYRNTDGNWRNSSGAAILPDSTAIGTGFLILDRAPAGQIAFSETL